MSTLREHSIIYREPVPCWREGASNSLAGITGRRKREAAVSHGHVYNLWAYTNITAHILVLNAKYEGPPSHPITFMTKEGGTFHMYIPCIQYLSVYSIKLTRGCYKTLQIEHIDLEPSHMLTPFLHCFHCFGFLLNISPKPLWYQRSSTYPIKL